MTAPWLKFYPSDWRADPALRMCSLAARGLWMEMLCLMHEAEPRGSLLINGRSINSKQLAALCGVSLRDVVACLSQLEAAGVFSREDNRTVYSRRMRRDEEKAARDKANGRGGGNPILKRGVNPPDKAQKPEARSQSSEDEPATSEKTNSENLAEPVGGRKPTRPSINGFFDEFWRVYPKRGDAANPRKPASEKFERAIRGGADPAVIIAAAARYAEIESTAGRSNTEKIAQAVTWLNQQRWQDYPAAMPTGVFVPPDPSMPSDAELRARYAARDPKPEDAGVFREGDGPHSTDEEAVRH
jgi:hypothetical protein